MARIAVILLAAGRSTRFAGQGGHKLLAPVAGVPVVRLSARAAIDAAVGDVVVVTGSERHAVAAVLADLPVRVVHAGDYVDGMSASLRRGVDSVRGSVEALVVALADQPTMQAETYRTVVATWRVTGASIVTPAYACATAPAHPTLFSADVLDELLDLRGDAGARSIIARDPGRVATAFIDSPAPRDIDTVEDLVAVASELTGRDLPGG